MHRAVIELMEQRQHLAATAGLVDGTLVVIGTERRDEIVANLLAERGRRTYSVTVNGDVLWTKTTRGEETMPPLLIDARGAADRVDAFAWNAPATVWGGAGADDIKGANVGDNALVGGSGDDTLTGYAFDDYFDAGTGDDLVNYTPGDIVHGGKGDDVATTSAISRDDVQQYMFGSGVESVLGTSSAFTHVYPRPSSTSIPFASVQWKRIGKRELEFTVKRQSFQAFDVELQSTFEGPTPIFRNTTINLTLSGAYDANWPMRRATKTIREGSVGYRSLELKDERQTVPIPREAFFGRPAVLAPVDVLGLDSPSFNDGILRVVTPLPAGNVEGDLGSPFRAGDRLVVPVLYTTTLNTGGTDDYRTPVRTLDLRGLLKGVRTVTLTNISGRVLSTVVNRPGPR